MSHIKKYERLRPVIRFEHEFAAPTHSYIAATADMRYSRPVFFRTVLGATCSLTLTLIASSALAQPDAQPAAPRKPAPPEKPDPIAPVDPKPGEEPTAQPEPGDPEPGDPAPKDPEPTDPEPTDPPETDDDDDDDDDEDDWGLEDIDDEEGGYQPPFVKADFSKPQPEGIVRLKHHKHRWFFHNLVAARLNPLGLTDRFRTGYRMQLSDRPETIFEESFASIALDTEITPAFGYAGARLEIQPVKLFNFWASYGVIGSFGTFSFTQSFPNVRENYHDDTLSDRRETEDYSTIGHKATLSGMFQVGIGGLALRSNVKGFYQAFDLKERNGVQDQTWYDPTLDVLMPNQGWVITNDADLLAVTDWDLIVGVRYTVTHAIYRDEHLAITNATQTNENTPHHRVGPALIYQLFNDEEAPSWNKLSFIVLAQWWAKHRYRTGTNPALPYLVLGFQQEGDFMISDKE